MKAPAPEKGQEDEFYPDAQERGDKVLRRLLKTKPDPKWKPPATKRKANQSTTKTS